MINEEQVKKSQQDWGNGAVKISSLRGYRAAFIFELFKSKYLIYHNLLLFRNLFS